MFIKGSTMKTIYILLLVVTSTFSIGSDVENISIEQKIAGLYVAYFNRAPDQIGINYWTQRAKEANDSSETLKELSAGFSQHPVFISAYNALDNRAFVEKIYKNSLGKVGDEEGIVYWTKILNEGKSRSDMVSEFIEISLTSNLKKEYFSNLTDDELSIAQERQDLISNKVKAGLKFVVLLGDKTNVKESQNLDDDPAYKASIKIIASITKEVFTLRNVIEFLNSIKDDINPIDKINITQINFKAYKLTHSNPKSSQNPCFSPDGKYLLYTRFLNGYNIGPSELVKISIDESKEKIIVPTNGSDNVNVPFGSWVEHQICFASDRGGEADEIWIVKDDGSNLRQITKHSEENGIYYIEPVFNPINSEQIVFEYVKGENDANAIHKIAFLDVKSKKVTLLTDGSFDDRLPSWSNDGKKILFQRKLYTEDEGWSSCISEIDTHNTPILKNIKILSYGSGDYTDCSWSYNDKYILCSTLFWDYPIIPNIWMLPLNKEFSPMQKTFNEENEDGAPSQSHDGNNIAFESHYGDSEDYPSEIWLIGK